MSYVPVLKVSSYFRPSATYVRLYYEPWGTVQ